MRRLGTRLTLPFVVVVLFLATAGSWMFTRQQFGTFEERQLARLSEGLVRAHATAGDLETATLETAAHVETVREVTESLRGGGGVPPAALSEVAGSGNVDALLVVRRSTSGAPELAGAAETLMPRASAAEVGSVVTSAPVAAVLAGRVDHLGDKFAEVNRIGLVTAAPVRDPDGTLLGAAVVLTRLETVAAAMREDAALGVAIHDVDGRLLVSTYDDGAGMHGPFALSPEAVVAAAEDANVVRTNWKGGTYTVGATPWRVRGVPQAILAVSASAAPVAVAVDATRSQVLLLFGVGLLAAVGIGMLFTRRVSRSVRCLRDGAEGIATGDFSTRIDLGGRDELAGLAGAFNTMAERLDQYRSEQNAVIGQLRALDEAKTELIANVSHELRTPLTPIKGAASMLRRDDLDATTRDQLVELIESNGDRLLSQVNRLIVVGAATAEGATLSATAVDLVRIVELEAPRVPGAGDRVRTLTPDGEVWAQADEAALRQVLHELVDNALKFTPGAVEIDVRRSEAGDGAPVVLCVSDAGPGMTEEELDLALVAFKQGDGSSTRRVGGLGVGLTVVQELVRAMGGEVTFTSDPARGTVVTVGLPASGVRVTSSRGAVCGGAGGGSTS
ncbi:MAG: HAMP domain-containing histidine kinase [Acidimicrobiia bacterium]|nr:HAMP domain-containing histidine kinase [Acidimicrobiia bacterium]